MNEKMALPVEEECRLRGIELTWTCNDKMTVKELREQLLKEFSEEIIARALADGGK